MSGSEYAAKLRDYRGRMCRDENVDGEVYSAASDWTRMMIAEMEREEECGNEKTRRPGRISLRTRLKYLVALILPQSAAGGKKVAQDA